MIRRIIILLSIFVFIAFISCFGGGGGNSGSVPPSGSNVKWGYLLPETKGIYYECGDIKGKTGPEGRFEYYEGQNVRFYIGGIELGTVAGQKIVTPFTLAGYDTVPENIQDVATEDELDQYPGARNRLHFLLAINELYEDGEYRYEELVETMESRHEELESKTLNFDTTVTVVEFQTSLGSLVAKSAWWSIFIKSCYAATIGSLNTTNLWR
jgi:hypothetical protein